MKRIAILGSTGSIGVNALDVVRRLGNGWSVTALAARSSWRRLLDQIREFRPAAAVLTDPAASEELRKSDPPCAVEPPSGLDALGMRDDVDIVLGGITGAAGLGACFGAVRAGKTLAVANKEALVMAGPLLLEEANRTGARIVPVDSEHSAVFQAMRAGPPDRSGNEWAPGRAGAPKEVRRIILTASGGPFLDLPMERFGSVTRAEALRHPTWNMGEKITIDSATMMNKALEVIEARWLFGLDPDRIEVLIHPQSIVHALVEFDDGSVLAQMGVPDMRVPIQYALTWPDRLRSDVQRLDLAEIGKLEFRPIDARRFPALELGFRAAREGGTLGAVMNAANEVAVAGFLAEKIRFPEISVIVRDVMNRHNVTKDPKMGDILAADAWARARAEERVP